MWCHVLCAVVGSNSELIILTSPATPSIGLLFVDAGNTTMRDSFFSEWAACADNYDCLIPDNIQIDKRSKHYLLNKYTIEEYGGVRVFK